MPQQTSRPIQVSFRQQPPPRQRTAEDDDPPTVVAYALAMPDRRNRVRAVSEAYKRCGDVWEALLRGGSPDEARRALRGR